MKKKVKVVVEHDENVYRQNFKLRLNVLKNLCKTRSNQTHLTFFFSKAKRQTLDDWFKRNQRNNNGPVSGSFRVIEDYFFRKFAKLFFWVVFAVQLLDKYTTAKQKKLKLK